MRSRALLWVAAALVTCASAIKFDLIAASDQDQNVHRRCFAQYVPKDTKVLVTVNVGEGYNQRVDFEVIIPFLTRVIACLHASLLDFRGWRAP